MTSQNKLVEGEDYTIDQNGRWVFTRQYHLKRGYCCQSGCLNCPYDYAKKTDPNIPSEFNDSWDSECYYDDQDDDLDD